MNKNWLVGGIVAFLVTTIGLSVSSFLYFTPQHDNQAETRRELLLLEIEAEKDIYKSSSLSISDLKKKLTNTQHLIPYPQELPSNIEEETKILYQRTLAMATGILGVNIFSHIVFIWDFVKQYKLVTNLYSDLQKIKATWLNIHNKLYEIGEVFIKYMIMSKEILISRTLLYRGTINGFSQEALESAVCNNINTQTIVTTSLGYKLGFFMTVRWSCSGEPVIDREAITFSQYSRSYAKVNSSNIAFVDRDGYLINVGDGEIRIDEELNGELNPGYAFTIPSGFDPDTYYYPEKKFKVTEIEVFKCRAFSL